MKSVPMNILNESKSLLDDEKKVYEKQIQDLKDEIQTLQQNKNKDYSSIEKELEDKNKDII